MVSIGKMKAMWDKKTDTKEIGNYVYGLAIPIYGSTYIVKYVGQACSSNVGRCFQHVEEAKKYLDKRVASNVKKVEMINYFASNEDFEIIILAHKIPDNQLDTMENIYRQLADYGALLFSIVENEIVFENNLTNIAATHNAKSVDDVDSGTMFVKPRTVWQINRMYANKMYLSSQQIAIKLNAKEILYVLNRPGIHDDGYIGSWRFNQKRLASDVEWLVFVGRNGFIEYVFKKEDIKFEVRDKKTRFYARNLTNYVDVLRKDIEGDPCFDVNGKGWNPFGNAFTYQSKL